MIERERLIKLIRKGIDEHSASTKRSCLRRWKIVSYNIAPCRQGFDRYLADCLLSIGVIVPPCKAGDTVYVIYRGEVTQGVVRLIRPFISQESTIFKGNVICEVDDPFLDDGSKEEVELYVVFEKSYGIERIAYLTKEEAEKALKERSEGK